MQKKVKNVGLLLQLANVVSKRERQHNSMHTNTYTHTHTVQVRTKTRLACEGGGSCNADDTLTQTKLKITWSVFPPFSRRLSQNLHPSVSPPSEPQRSRSRLFEEGVGDSASVDDVAALSFAARSGSYTIFFDFHLLSLKENEFTTESRHYV